MSEPIKTTYRDVEITYLEDPNRWRFTANGRERSAESLVKAREAIDRALDAERKEKPWEPFEAYFGKGYNDDDFVRVKVTSVAEGGAFSRETQFWISRKGARGKSERSKESISRLYKVNPENEALMAKMAELAAERERIDDALSDARRQLVNIEVPT